ncbi:MAG TPA: chalcone isomerase family protein [Myxococcaceae bacterium]|nr:chalcone isomerase family protein [Myxococcaceae bacterium]
MLRYALISLLCLTFSSPVFAKELAGVKLADTIEVEGKTLQLNGIALRKKFIFDVYVAGLYLENTSKNAQQILNSDQTKVVRMVMRRDLEGKAIVDAIRDGFEKNAGDKLPQLKERLDNFISGMPPSVKSNDVINLTYVPGKGTRVESKSGKEINVEGKDFADALFSVFIGQHPVDKGMKKNLLGQ